MTKNEKAIHEAAEARMPGRGGTMVTIYRALRDKPGRGAGLGAAMMISVFINNPTADVLESLRRSVRKDPPKRDGQKMDRYTAACDALVTLEGHVGSDVRRVTH